jgi:hypothetical protein
VDDRPIVWDAANRKHLGSDHPERNISIAEIEEALHDAGRIETELPDRQAIQVIGLTVAGRWLVVIWIDDPDGATRSMRVSRPGESFGGLVNEERGNQKTVQRPVRRVE